VPKSCVEFLFLNLRFVFCLLLSLFVFDVVDVVVVDDVVVVAVVVV